MDLLDSTPDHRQEEIDGGALQCKSSEFNSLDVAQRSLLDAKDRGAGNELSEDAKRLRY